MSPIAGLAPSVGSINTSPSRGGDGPAQHADTFQASQPEKQGHKNSQHPPAELINPDCNGASCWRPPAKMPLCEFSSQMTIAFNPTVSGGFFLVLLQPLPTAASTGRTNKWEDYTYQGTSTGLFKTFTVPVVPLIGEINYSTSFCCTVKDIMTPRHGAFRCVRGDRDICFALK